MSDASNENETGGDELSGSTGGGPQFSTPPSPWWAPPAGPTDPGTSGRGVSGWAGAPPPWAPSPSQTQPPHWYGGPGWHWAPHGGWGAPAPAPARSGRTHSLLVAAGSLLTAAAVLAGVGIGYAAFRSTTSTTSSSGGGRSTFTPATTSRTTGSSKSSSAAGSPSNIATIAAKVDPALVDINTVLGDETAEAAGTGIVLTSTGKVLTNNHVIEGSTSISVTDLGNDKTYNASVIGYDRTHDVAVIQLKTASGLTTATLGNSSTASVGQAVVGIGNAGGTGGTPSAAGGSITALDEAITASDEGAGTTEHLTGLIETNCDIQPGDSGGPLVTTTGEVIGMDTAASAAQGFSFSGAVTGEGYAIPINSALTIAKQIEAGKASADVHIGPTAFLGVEVQSTSSRSFTGGFRFGLGTATATPSSFGTATSGSSSSGAYVEGVLANTPASKIGIGRGDTITSVGGTQVTSPNSLSKVIEQYKPGTTAKVVWTTSSGEQQSATVTFQSGPAG